MVAHQATVMGENLRRCHQRSFQSTGARDASTQVSSHDPALEAVPGYTFPDQAITMNEWNRNTMGTLQDNPASMQYLTSMIPQGRVENTLNPRLQDLFLQYGESDPWTPEQPWRTGAIRSMSGSSNQVTNSMSFMTEAETPIPMNQGLMDEDSNDHPVQSPVPIITHLDGNLLMMLQPYATPPGNRTSDELTREMSTGLQIQATNSAPFW